MTALAHRSVRRAATGPQPNSKRLDVWGDGGEYDVGDGSVDAAICNGDHDALMKQLRQAEELSPKVSSALAEMLDPNSSYIWRLHLKRRKAGNPQSAASLVSVDSALNRIRETPISIESAHEIAAMLDPNSDHRFRLHLRKRNRGPRQRPLNMKIYFAVKNALESRQPIKNLVIDLKESHGIGRKTFYSYKKIIERDERKSIKRNIAVQNPNSP